MFTLSLWYGEAKGFIGWRHITNKEPVLEVTFLRKTRGLLAKLDFALEIEYPMTMGHNLSHLQSFSFFLYFADQHHNYKFYLHFTNFVQ